MERPILTDITKSVSYLKLEEAVIHDETKSSGWHDYRGKLSWIVERAEHYAEKLGTDAIAVMDAWESARDYWYMNYYQESKQPLISDQVRVFASADEAQAAFDNKGFRCPRCAKIGKSPYECQGPDCDWKAYGLFGTLGKGLHVVLRDRMLGETIFYPVALEDTTSK